MNSKHRWGVRLLAAALALSVASGAMAASKRIKPDSHGGAVKVLIAKKSYTYYRIDPQKPIEFRVTGPTPVRISSRHLYPAPGVSGRVAYKLRVDIDGVLLKTATLRAGASGSASLKSGARIGGLKETIIRVPAGQHTIRISCSGNEPGAAVRLYLDSGKKSAGRWIPYAPESYLESVRLQSKEVESTYYRFDRMQPAEITVKGPLKLRVGTRVDFGTTNGYTQRYVVRCLLDEQPWKSFSLSSTASHTSTYPEHPEITPGIERRIELNVPSGPRRVTIFLDGTAAGAAALRVQVNEKDLNAGRKPRNGAANGR